MSVGKIEKLMDIEGFESVDEMLEEATFGLRCPGICTNDGCDYTTEVDPDGAGFCEECNTTTVESSLMLMGMM